MNDDRRDQQEETKDAEESKVEEEITKDPVEEELEQLKGLSQQLENNYKRALADYQNLQRRTQEEKVEWIRMAGKDLVLKFLPVLDTLILAQNHLQDKGLALSVDQFIKALAEEGVTRIETVGKEFDATRMEAVTTKEADKKDTGMVIEETRAGFMYHDMVLRPAQVIVGA